MKDQQFNYFRHPMPYLPNHGCTGKLIVIEGTDGSGRSTQARMLKQWLEVQGYGVLDTGWTRSKLVGQAITDLKEGHSLHRLTYCLMYATDLADRLEYQILPALKSGFIVLADRYIYTAIARGVVRGAEREWLNNLYGFALVPDMVFYLRIGTRDLVPRVLESQKMNYWESGMDMNYGDDLYDSFVAYQSALIEQFDMLSAEYNFLTLDARQETQHIQQHLRHAVRLYLEQTPTPTDTPETRLPQPTTSETD